MSNAYPKDTPWAAYEVDLLRALYPRGGRRAVAAVLPKRSIDQIAYRAKALGLRFIPPTPEQVAERERVRHRRDRQARRAELTASLMLRRRTNLAMGLCKCGNEPKPGSKWCSRCLTVGARFMYVKRFGVEPAGKCKACRKWWAKPGSEYCGRHQSVARAAEARGS